MSLVGNLEDLGLGDILQIVSLSRKSGILALQSREREGTVVFNNGEVVRATSSVIRENLGDLLLRKELVDLDTLKQAIQVQREETPDVRLGTILAERFGVSADAINEAVREQIERIVYSFFGWMEGTFSFELGELKEQETTRFNPLQFILDKGLNPQWLAMEGSRILDEKRHQGGALEDEVVESKVDLGALLGDGDNDASAAVDSSPEQELPPVTADEDHSASTAPSSDAKNGSSQTVLIVDDDDLTVEMLAEQLRVHGFEVVGCRTAAEFETRLDALIAKGGKPRLLVDMIMPRVDGGGLLGGLELLEVVCARHHGLDLVVMTDYENAEAAARLRELGAREILEKPSKDQLQQIQGQRQIAALATAYVNLKTTAAASTLPAGMINIGAELMLEFGDDEPSSLPQRGPESPGLHLLKGMLQELNNPALGGGIILLVLRFASELMNRAVIFLVKEQEIVGLGQFGIELNGESADVRVRKMRIVRGEESVFNQVVSSMAPVKTRLTPCRWDQYLINELGGDDPQEVFLGPLVSEGRVVALLYGDNLPEQKKIGDTEALEVFLSQAGLAMEKAVMERRMQNRNAV
ncbi:MAG: response regulator [Desulfuromonadales bacterium]|nr:response regulator [Desulfuromonadales bacterium]